MNISKKFQNPTSCSLILQHFPFPNKKMKIKREKIKGRRKWKIKED
jgi:hypothetical protein